ncbi:MAG TPA: GntR family transcriptional regulator [Edaphobacter sp.]|nr:GntR family transcriptional regulator [Edaphobacter sp.]
MAKLQKPALRKESLSARERAYRHIQEQIAQGVLGAGMPLSELLLAKELGSSRTPIREAIGQLAAEGLVEQTRNRGAVVRQMTRNDITDLYEVREALEVFAASKVAMRGVPVDDLARLQEANAGILELRDELIASGQTTLDDERIERFVRLDLSFHALIVLLTLNARMRKIINETRVLIQIFAMRRRGHDAAMLDRIWRQHTAVTEALVNRRPEEARQILSEHIQNSLRERLEEFDAWDRQNAMAADMAGMTGRGKLLSLR